MAKGLRARFFGSRLYDLTLGRRAATPRRLPPAIWRAPVTLPLEEDRFEWLCNLSGDGDLEPSAARARIDTWLAANRHWHAETWRADRLGDRICFGLSHYDVLCQDAPAAFVTDFGAALNRQARHLFRIGRAERAEGDALRAWRGAIFAALFLPAFERRLGDAVGGLIDDLPRWVFPDGGHLARQPQKHLEALATLVQVRMTLAAARVEVPELLQSAIDRMAPMLRAYRHGDGGLGLFNGAGEGVAATAERVLELTGSRAKAAASAPHTGFHRISAQRTVVMFDTGVPVAAPGTPGHAGTLSFELSVGAHRLIVNCGGVTGRQNSDLAEALRATAAHATLTVADVNSSDLIAGGGFGARRARIVSARRREQDRNVLIEASHDGYAEPFGLTHRRLLYLARDGLDLRGEDVLEANTGTGRTFDIRFHLHPDVRASLAHGGRSALLKLPTGRGWRLSISDGVLGLEESIYAGVGAPRASAQLVISGRHARRRTVTKWRLAREG